MINARPAPQPDGSDYQTRQTAMRKAVAPQQDLIFLVSANVVDLAFVA